MEILLGYKELSLDEVVSLAAKTLKVGLTD